MKQVTGNFRKFLTPSGWTKAAKLTLTINSLDYCHMYSLLNTRNDANAAAKAELASDSDSDSDDSDSDDDDDDDDDDE